MVSDGTNVTGAYSTDGTTWIPVGRPGAASRRTASSGCSRSPTPATGNPIAAFDSFTLTGENVAVAAARPPGRAGTTSSTDGTPGQGPLERDRARHPGRVRRGRRQANDHDGAGRHLHGRHEPRRRTTSSCSRRTTPGADWVIETKIDGATIDGGYGQGGLMAYQDGDNYVKFDAISDVGQPAYQPARAALGDGGSDRREPGRPADRGRRDHDLAAPDQDRRRTTRGEYSLDGDCLDGAFATPVTNPMAAPAVRPLRVRAAGRGPGRPGAVRVLHARRRGHGRCSCTADGNGRRLRRHEPRQGRAGTRSRNEDTTKYDGRRRRAEGHDRERRRSATRRRTSSCRPRTTPAPTGSSRPSSRARSSTATSRAAWWLGRRRGLREARRDLGRRVRPDQPDRAALAGRRHVRQPQPNIDVPTGTTDIWLRLKTGQRPTRAVLASTARPGRRSAPRWRTPWRAAAFGLYTVGVNAEGGTVTFDQLQGRREGRLRRRRRAGNARRCSAP